MSNCSTCAAAGCTLDVSWQEKKTTQFQSVKLLALIKIRVKMQMVEKRFNQ